MVHMHVTHAVYSYFTDKNLSSHFDWSYQTQWAFFATEKQIQWQS